MVMTSPRTHENSVWQAEHVGRMQMVEPSGDGVAAILPCRQQEEPQLAAAGVEIKVGAAADGVYVAVLNVAAETPLCGFPIRLLSSFCFHFLSGSSRSARI